MLPTIPFEETINGTSYMFTKHQHMGMPYYSIDDGFKLILIPKNGTWTFLNPETVPPEILAIKDQLVLAIERHEKLHGQT